MPTYVMGHGGDEDDKRNDLTVAGKGFITSPSYPGPYPTNLERNITIKVHHLYSLCLLCLPLPFHCNQSINQVCNQSITITVAHSQIECTRKIISNLYDNSRNKYLCLFVCLIVYPSYSNSHKTFMLFFLQSVDLFLHSSWWDV